jgi:predicted methyltransferase
MRQKFYFLNSHIINQIRQFKDLTQPVPLNISFDLGLTYISGQFISPNTLKCDHLKLLVGDDIFRSQDRRNIYILRDQRWEKWQRFDELHGTYYKMVFVNPESPPTIEISGIKMHSTQNGNPRLDTRNKIDSFQNIKGKVLDTCMGLGYTAIAAAAISRVENVISCERSRIMVQFCRENPWSQPLFNHPKIHPLLYPVHNFITTLPDRFFQTVIHDPPRFSLAAELYSENFYRELFRTLTPGGELYHYTGDPHKKTRKISLVQKTRGILQKIGFRDIKYKYSGLVARK